MKWLGLLLAALSSTAHASPAWRAGVAHIELVPPYAVALAGYGGSVRRLGTSEMFKYPDAKLLRPNEGIHDPIRVKVVHLEAPGKKRGTTQKVLFIGMDVVAAPSELRDEIARRLKPLGYEAVQIIISGSHTHSGPGALSNNLFWGVMATDLFHQKFYNWWVERMVRAVKMAAARMEPAELFHARFQVAGIQHNRRNPAHVVDEDAQALMIRTPDGRWMGGLLNFAIHGVSVDQTNLLLSADNPGAIERHVEAFLRARTRDLGSDYEPTVMFINGAEGDVNPTERGFSGAERIGRVFADRLEAAWPDLAPLASAGGIRLREIRVKLDGPRLVIERCGDNALIKRFRFGLNRWFPDSAVLTQLRIGGIQMLSWPGEPTSELGLELKRVAMARDPSIQEAWVLGLTNGHLGYFVSPWDYDLGGYETCVNFYGRDGGSRIRDAHLGALRASGPNSAPLLQGR